MGRVASEVADAGELITEGLACRRGERLVFAGLDCRLPAGGALVLTGSNGSGKSSLLRLLATLLIPAAGRLLWGGVPVARDMAHYRAAVHYVGHLDATKPALTPRETLGFWAALRGTAAPDIDASPAIDRALVDFGLGAVADWPCRWLSAGQRRRLALARLVASPAPIWLLDEPNAALDRDGETRLAAAIATHRGAGGRVAIATHQPVAPEAAVVIVLDDFAASAGDALASLW
jgi:heme exporter protein A